MLHHSALKKIYHHLIHSQEVYEMSFHIMKVKDIWSCQATHVGAMQTLLKMLKQLALNRLYTFLSPFHVSLERWKMAQDAHIYCMQLHILFSYWANYSHFYLQLSLLVCDGHLIVFQEPWNLLQTVFEKIGAITLMSVAKILHLKIDDS